MTIILYKVFNFFRCAGLAAIGTVLFLLILPSSLLYGGRAGVKELVGNYAHLMQTAHKLHKQKPRT